MTNCETCGRLIFIGCTSCLYRERDLIWYGKLNVGDRINITNSDVICGKFRKNEDGTFYIPSAEIVVEAKAEFKERISLTVERKKDSKKFVINLTKPGPWDNYNFAEEILDAKSS